MQASGNAYKEDAMGRGQMLWLPVVVMVES
jgi:hypothetical protein